MFRRQFDASSVCTTVTELVLLCATHTPRQTATQTERLRDRQTSQSSSVVAARVDDVVRRAAGDHQSVDGGRRGEELRHHTSSQVPRHGPRQPVDPQRARAAAAAAGRGRGRAGEAEQSSRLLAVESPLQSVERGRQSTLAYPSPRRQRYGRQRRAVLARVAAACQRCRQNLLLAVRRLEHRRTRLHVRFTATQEPLVNITHLCTRTLTPPPVSEASIAPATVDQYLPLASYFNSTPCMLLLLSVDGSDRQTDGQTRSTRPFHGRFYAN